MVTELIQTGEPSLMTVKDDILETTVISHWMKRACVKL
jgi:hypothetical protein